MAFFRETPARGLKNNTKRWNVPAVYAVNFQGVFIPSETAGTDLYPAVTDGIGFDSIGFSWNDPFHYLLCRRREENNVYMAFVSINPIFYKPIFEHTLIVKKSTLYVQPQDYVDSIFQGFYSL